MSFTPTVGRGKCVNEAWLANHIKDNKLVAMKGNAGLTDSLVAMFHVGRFMECGYWSRAWSVVCIVEYLTRHYFYTQNCMKGYPLRTIFTVGNNGFSKFVPSLKFGQLLKRNYEEMKVDLYNTCRVKLMKLDTFQGVFHLSKRVLVHFANVLRTLTAHHEHVLTVDHVWCNLFIVHELLSKVSRNKLRSSFKDVINVTDVALLLNGNRLTIMPGHGSVTEKQLDNSVKEDTESANSITMDGKHMMAVDYDYEYESTTGDCNGIDDSLSFENLSLSSVASGDAMDEFELPNFGKGSIGWDVFDSADSSEETSLDSRQVQIPPRQKTWGKHIQTPQVVHITTPSPEQSPKASSEDDSETPHKHQPPRRQLTRGIRYPVNPVHFEEDINIRQPIAAAMAIVKPGIINTAGVTDLLDESITTTTTTTSTGGFMFDKDAREFRTSTSNLPMIFIESFRNTKGDLVAGPYKYMNSDKKPVAFKIGSSYLNLSGLASVLCCQTSNAYVYFFKDANLKPHFVAGKKEGMEYKQKLIEVEDVDLRVIPNWKLSQPVKVLSDFSIAEGLREGLKEESDFIFVSDQTKLFKMYFGDMNRLAFPTAKWMDFFDNQTSKADKHGRNFQFGHHDCGYGREGVASNAYQSQAEGIESIVGKPLIIGNREMMATLGPLVDKTTLLMDAICFENDERLMNDQFRDSVFGEKLRKQTNSKHLRHDAFTVVRQPLGHPEEVQTGNFNFPGTGRHLDGPNCERQGYRQTAVFSYHCVWKTIVYRIGIIMYTRQSCGNYCWRNYLARILRRRLRDYIVESNGGIHYKDFSLTNSMDQWHGLRIKKKNSTRPDYILCPKLNDLTRTFFERKPNSEWRKYKQQESNLKWELFDWDKKMPEPVKMFTVPEFLCRYGFVSSFAYQINCFIDADGITPEEMVWELIYIALLSTSQVQFYYLLKLMIRIKDVLIRNYESEKTSTLGATDVTLFRYYQLLSQRHFTCVTGGPYFRYQGQPTKKQAIFFDDNVLRKNLEKIPFIINKIEEGGYLGKQDGAMKEKPGAELAMIDMVGYLSCAPIVVFIGKASSVHAINTAKQSMVNTDSKNSYYKDLKDFLNENDRGMPKMKKDHKFLFRLFKSIAKSWNTVIGSVENGCCAEFRTSKKRDVFFHGQDLYLLNDESSNVLVKPFGACEWSSMIFK